MPNLTERALLDIMEGRPPSDSKPVLQVLNLKKIQTNTSSPDRYRVQLSDGINYLPCMMSPQLNHLVTSNMLEKYCLIQMGKYVCNSVHNRSKKIIIVIQASVIKGANEVGGSIGNPAPLNNTSAEGASENGATNGHPGGAKIPSANVSQTPPTGGYHNAAPPSRPSYSGPSMLTSPGGTPLSSRNIIPITGLNPYQNKWTIKARVTSKPAIRTWSNSRGEGRICSVDLVDATGDVRATAFNELADKIHGLFEMGKVYYVSRGRLKPANRAFNSTSCEYEISLNDDSGIELCTENDKSVPTLQYTFVPIEKLDQIEPNATVDIIGVCKDASSLTTIVTKTTNKKITKRDIELVDRSSHGVSCTLWGAEAEGFQEGGYPIIAIKAARVSDFGGRTLSVSFNSVMTVNPDIQEAHQLRGWFDNFGKNVETTSVSGTRTAGTGQTACLTLSQVKELNLGQREKPDYFQAKATVIYAKKENCLYKACSSQDCNKKVTEDNTGGYFCDKCNKSSPSFKYKMILTLNTADHTGNQWVTCFEDTGSAILGKSAQELGELKEADENAFDNVFQQANFRQYVFKNRAKMDTYNDEQKLKCYCVNVTKSNFVQETKRNIELIKELM